MHWVHVRDVQSSVGPLTVTKLTITEFHRVYTTSAIRGNSLTSDFGGHLETCPASNGTIPNWPDVQDQQIPKSLQVSQNLNQNQAGSYSGASIGMAMDWWRIWLGVMAVSIVRLSVSEMVDDPVDLCFT